MFRSLESPAGEIINIRKSLNCVLTMSSRERLYTKISNFATEESIIYILNVLFSCYFAEDYENNKVFKIKKFKNSWNMTEIAILKEMQDYSAFCIGNEILKEKAFRRFIFSSEGFSYGKFHVFSQFLRILAAFMKLSFVFMFYIEIINSRCYTSDIETNRTP